MAPDLKTNLAENYQKESGGKLYGSRSRKLFASTPMARSQKESG